jgi:hypothetical protein
VLPSSAADSGAELSPAATVPKPAAKQLPTNCTRVSTTDPEAEPARSKNGLIEQLDQLVGRIALPKVWREHKPSFAV